MILLHAALPLRLRRLAPLALACTMAACTSTDGLFSGEKVDYKSAAASTKSLEVPPDLTQLARESRYQPRGGVVSASAVAAPAPATAASAPAAAQPAVALARAGDLRLERQGPQRWLVTSRTPEQLWPQLRTFWEERGFRLEVDDAPAGVMETTWSENRARLPNDAVRNTIGRLLGNLYDTGERDRFRTRLERTAAGTEIYVTHRGIEEVVVGELRESTRWRPRASDPELEAEMLSRLMVALGSAPEQARAAVAAAPSASAPAGAAPPLSAPAAPGRARALAGAGGNALEIDEPFDRAWRQVGLALDRGGFTVEDRDRAAGFYYVRYVDPRYAGHESPGFWARLFGDGNNPQAAVRYRIAVKAADNRSTVTVQTSAGGSEVGENGQRIATVLLQELR